MKQKYFLLLLPIVFLIPLSYASALQIDENQPVVTVIISEPDQMGKFIEDYETTAEPRIAEMQEKVNELLDNFTTDANWSLSTDEGIVKLSSYIRLTGDTNTNIKQYEQKYNFFVGETRTAMSDFLTEQGITSSINWELHYKWGTAKLAE